MKKPLIILTGPTAVGKTQLSLSLARAVKGSIVSADSMQVYRGMDIGSAKIKPEEMEGIPHYLIDAIDPKEEFHVALFQKMAKNAMEEIYEAGRIPILAGGTGFYIQAVLYDIDFTEEKEDLSYRSSLESFAKEHGADALHGLLRQVDEGAAAEIHPNNIKRVIRGLEYHHLTGQKISEHNRQQRQKESPYAFCYFVLNDKREKLYQAIDLRVEQMMDKGLLEEVTALQTAGLSKDMVSMQGLGYKELLSYLEGTLTLKEAVYLIKRDTRHFAKRQLTWFRRERDVIWLDKQEFGYDNNKILDYMKQKMTEAGINLP